MIQKLIHLLRGAGSAQKEPQNQKLSPEMIQGLSTYLSDSFANLKAEFIAKEDLNLSPSALPEKKAPRPKTASTPKAVTQKTAVVSKVNAAKKPATKKATSAAKSGSASSKAAKPGITKTKPKAETSKAGKTNATKPE